MRFSDAAVSAVLTERRVVSVVPFPGAPEDSGIRIGIRGLTEGEADAARIQGQLYIASLCKRNDVVMHNYITIDPEALDIEYRRQLLVIACVDPDNHDAKFFDSAEQIRKLDSVIIDRLHECYMEHQSLVNPYLTMSDDELKELADAIKKEPTGTHILAVYERATLVSLVRSLARLHAP